MTDLADNYAGLATEYDRQRMDWFATTHGDALIQLLQARGVSNGRLLDVGCGTGSLALKLAASGYEVAGLDRSAALLAQARRKPGAERIEWIEADVLTWCSEPVYDVIVSTADVLNHLPTLDDWQRVLTALAGALRRGGLLFLDVATCWGLEQMDVYCVNDRAEGALIIGAIWDPQLRCSSMKISSYSPTDTVGLYRRCSNTIAEWGQPVAAILRRVETAGFERLERPWSKAEDPESDERLQLIARRR